MKINNTTVHTLRTQGYKVKIKHHRYLGDKLFSTRKLYEMGKMSEVEAKGGRTDITVITPDGAKYSDSAECHRSDPFVYKIAVSIALGRILKVIERIKNGEFLNTKEVTKKLLAKKGKIFTITFKKRGDGSIRRLNGIVSKDDKLNFTNNLVTVKEMCNGNYRTIPVDSVVDIK